MNSVAFSPDGERIVSGSGDNTILVWDWMAEKVILGPLLGHTRGVFSVACSPDGQRIASGSFDKDVMVWDAKSGERLHRLTKHTQVVRSVAFSADSRMIASGSEDETIQIWDAQTGEIVHSMTFGAKVYSVMFSPNGEHLVIGTVSSVEVRDVQGWKRVCGSVGRRWAVTVSPDSQHVAYDAGNNVCIMDLKTGKPIMGSMIGHIGVVSSLAFSPDGTWITSGSYDKSIRIWDTATGQKFSRLQTESWVLSIAMSPSGMQIAAGCWENDTICLYSCDPVL